MDDASSAHPPGGEAARGSVRVVVADDSAGMRALLRAQLGTVDGVRIVGVAADGTEAVDAGGPGGARPGAAGHRDAHYGWVGGDRRDPSTPAHGQDRGAVRVQRGADGRPRAGRGGGRLPGKGRPHRGTRRADPAAVPGSAPGRSPARGTRRRGRPGRCRRDDGHAPLPPAGRRDRRRRARRRREPAGGVGKRRGRPDSGGPDQPAAGPPAATSSAWAFPPTARSPWRSVGAPGRPCRCRCRTRRERHDGWWCRPGRCWNRGRRCRPRCWCPSTTTPSGAAPKATTRRWPPACPTSPWWSSGTICGSPSRPGPGWPPRAGGPRIFLAARRRRCSARTGPGR